MQSHSVSIHKIERNTTNEDAAIHDSGRIAISDGAGGGGVYADLWSSYLLQHLPLKPLTFADELDEWIGKIWETYYNACEVKAKKAGGLLLDKFYDEGSFATLAAVWKTDRHHCFWMTYGDSVVFHYNRKTQVLQHSFTRLSDFNQPPYLINCKDPLDKTGYRSGIFELDRDSVVFATSDTLSHYILMCYEVLHQDSYNDELQEAIDYHSKNTALIEQAKALITGKRFYKDILKPIIKASCKKGTFISLMASLEAKSLLGHDDYSFCWMKG